MGLISVVCILGAIYLAAVGIGGWGWFIFAAIITHASE